MLLSVSGGRDLRQLAQALRTAGDPQKIRGDLRKDVAAAMKPMQQAVQDNVKATPARGAKHTGLRRDVARATRIRVLASSAQAAVKLEVAPSRMPAGKRSLPALLDGRGRWRHPVYGNRNAWVTQASHPFFWRGVQPHIQDVRDAVVDAVERAMSKI